VTGFQFGSAAFVGVALDFVKGIACLGNKATALLLEGSK
jgi:hypothetical protein